MTNGDKIRQMTDEELADMIFSGKGYEPLECRIEGICVSNSCRSCCIEWLKQEVEE